MTEIAYAVHTRKCTYLLDDDGICRWAVFPGGRVAPGTDRSVGAQFVACLDLRAEGGLVGELHVGASALFAREEQGRLVLLRTLPIEHVEKRTPWDAPFRDDPTEVLGPDQPWAAHAPMDEAHTPEPLTPVARFPAFALPVVPPAPEEEGEPLDLEDLLSISVSEVARTMPLYRPPPGAPPPAPWPYARAPLPPPRPPPRPPSAPPPAAAAPLPPPRPPVRQRAVPPPAPRAVDPRRRPR